jgi:hypothetical protein
MELFRKLTRFLRAKNLTVLFTYCLNYSVIIYKVVQFNYNIKGTTMRTGIRWLMMFSRLRTWTSRAIARTHTHTDFISDR